MMGGLSLIYNVITVNRVFISQSRLKQKRTEREGALEEHKDVCLHSSSDVLFKTQFFTNIRHFQGNCHIICFLTFLKCTLELQSQI